MNDYDVDELNDAHNRSFTAYPLDQVNLVIGTSVDNSYQSASNSKQFDPLISSDPLAKALKEISELKKSNEVLEASLASQNNRFGFGMLVIFIAFLLTWWSIRDAHNQHVKLETTQMALDADFKNLSSSFYSFVKLENGNVFLAPKGLRIGHFKLQSEAANNFVIRPDFPDGGDYRYAFYSKKFVDL